MKKELVKFKHENSITDKNVELKIDLIMSSILPFILHFTFAIIIHFSVICQGGVACAPHL
uniref:Uncharacterized protein n=1 Tax=Agrobacterium tumefaciens TaxID=358 RepID=A0A2Z2Q044_AGRTU|nr:hypothetical protein [Agrobacterium tumefaciens]ASK47192.1 hypothetical protein [Agrobacterium radiobacter]